MPTPYIILKNFSVSDRKLLLHLALHSAYMLQKIWIKH